MDQNMTYENASAKLKELVDELEKGDKTLEDTVKLYDEAVKLSGYITALLNNAKLKITEISNIDKDNKV